MNTTPVATATETILRDLVAFESITRHSNMELIAYIESCLQGLGIDSVLTFDETRCKANLYAVIPAENTADNSGGVMLSGHTDVVPVAGQDWSKPPFSLVAEADRLYGRGTTDMKGFIASVLAMLPYACRAAMKRPLHLAFSYDEEIGCVGVRRMIDMLAASPEQPDFCIIGEPTSLQVAIAHKGKTGMICRCRGIEGHSALVDRGVNAIYLATEMIQGIRDLQQSLTTESGGDSLFAVPYSSLHVGTIQGGTALNIIPNHCEFQFEMRNLEHDSPAHMLEKLNVLAREVAEPYQRNYPGVGIEIEVFNTYPALQTEADSAVVKFVQALLDDHQTIGLDFGTEGGLFQNNLNIPTVVCGPGSMDQGHKPDEYITRQQLMLCDRFLHRLVDRLCEAEWHCV